MMATTVVVVVFALTTIPSQGLNPWTTREYRHTSYDLDQSLRDGPKVPDGYGYIGPSLEDMFGGYKRKSFSNVDASSHKGVASRKVYSYSDLISRPTKHNKAKTLHDYVDYDDKSAYGDTEDYQKASDRGGYHKKSHHVKHKHKGKHSHKHYHHHYHHKAKKSHYGYH